MVSSTSPTFNLTIHNSASPSYPLKVMTVVALVLLPVVLAYTAWTYYVFRRRISDKAIATATGDQQTRNHRLKRRGSHDHVH